MSICVEIGVTWACAPTPSSPPTPGAIVVERGHAQQPARHLHRRRLSAYPSTGHRPPAQTAHKANDAASVFKEAINVKQNRSAAAMSLLTAAALALSACSNSHATLAYATGVKVDCGGKQTLAASGSTAQANAMTKFIDAYHKACSGQNLNYTANGSGAGISDFLAGKTDFGGSDTPLSGDQYGAAK